MAANTDPRVVNFDNQKVRPMADLLNSAYQSAVTFVELWNAQQIGTLIPFDANLIVDGATVNGIDATGGDGRPIIRNQDAEQIYNICSNLISFFDKDTLDNSGTANEAIRTNVLLVQVNGKSIF